MYHVAMERFAKWKLLGNLFFWETFILTDENLAFMHVVAKKRDEWFDFTVSMIPMSTVIIKNEKECGLQVNL